MIKSFADKETERLFNREPVRKFQAFARVALRGLTTLDQAASLNDLKGTGAKLELLKKDLAGFHAIRITGQVRIIFHWIDGNAHDVRIIDYH